LHSKQARTGVYDEVIAVIDSEGEQDAVAAAGEPGEDGFGALSNVDWMVGGDCRRGKRHDASG
jgi:hypothetical protein